MHIVIQYHTMQRHATQYHASMVSDGMRYVT